MEPTSYQISKEEYEKYQNYLRQQEKISKNQKQSEQIKNQQISKDSKLISMDFNHLIEQNQNDDKKQRNTVNVISQSEKINKSYFDWELPSEQWQEDKSAKRCLKCKRDFSVFVWKSHCRKCGRVFCSKCILERVFELDGSRIIDSQIIKKREAEIKQKLRVIKVCEGCDDNLSSFEKSVSRITQLNVLTRNQSSFSRQKTVPLSQFSENDSDRLSGNGINNEQKSIRFSSQSKYPAEFQPSNNRNNAFGFEQMPQKTDLNRGFKPRDSQQVKEFIETLKFEDTNIKGRHDDDKSSRLLEFSRRHISKVVAMQLFAADIDISKWYSLIKGFVIDAVEQIRPSSRLLNDSMNLNDFVKIKIIDWKDNSQSKYINGIVMSKNLSDKRMLKEIKNPSILLLKNILEIGHEDLESEKEQEEHLIKVMSMKIEQIQPQIVMVEKDVTYKILCMLRDTHKVTVVSNIEENKMIRIARQTQTITANGATEINQRFALGKCQHFIVKNQSKLARDQGFSLSTGKQGKELGSVEDQFIMILDGCNPALGCTILLSGLPSEKNELRKIKFTIKKILLIARSIYLERFYLEMLNIKIPSPPILEKNFLESSEQNIFQNVDAYKDFVQKFEQTDAITPFLITQPIENRSMLIYQQFSIRLRTQKDLSTDEMLFNQNYHDTKMILDEHLNVNEDYVYSKIDKICGVPQKKRVKFFNQKYDAQGSASISNDITLGKYLEQISSQIGLSCDFCHSDLIHHGIEIYHNDGRVNISIEQKNKTKISANLNSKQLQISDIQNNINFYLKCKQCQIKTSQTTFSNQVYEYSTARLFEQLFYNKKLYALDQCSCNCYNIKDGNGVQLRENFVFIFEIKNFMKIQFLFQPIDVYKIELVLPKKFDISNNLKLIVNEQNDQIMNNITRVIEIFKDRFKVVRSHTQNSLTLSFPENKVDVSFQMLMSKLKRIDEIFERIDSNVTQMFNDVISEFTKLDSDVFAAFFLTRKLYLNLLSFQRIFQEVTKFAALLIVLCRRRSENQLINVTKDPQNNFKIQLKSEEQETLADAQNKINIQESLKSPTENNTSAQTQIDESIKVQNQNKLLQMQNKTIILDSSPIRNEEQKKSSDLQKYQSVGKQKIKQRSASNQNELSLKHQSAQNKEEVKDSNQKNNSHCFIEELSDFANKSVGGDKLRKKQNLRNSQAYGYSEKSQICPLSLKNSTCCNNPVTIVASYQQICDDVQEQLHEMHQMYQNHTQKNFNNISPKSDDEISSSIDFVDKSGKNPNFSAILEKYKVSQNQTSILNQENEQFQFPIQQLDRSRGGSFAQNKALKNLLEKQTLQKSRFLSLIDGIYNPYLTLPLGVDNIFIQIWPDDIGSIIAFGLNSNVYFEALAKLKYMGLESKINKQKDKPKDQVEQVCLIGKDDVFNYEPVNKSNLEQEMLQSSKIEFKIKFSTYSKDVSVKIKGDKNEEQLKGASIHFKTCKTVNHKKKYNDLQTRILPNISKEYLKNSQCNESLSDLENVFSEVSNYYLDKEKQQKLQQHILNLNAQQQTTLQQQMQQWNYSQIALVNLSKRDQDKNLSKQMQDSVDENFVVVNEETLPNSSKIDRTSLQNDYLKGQDSTQMNIPTQQAEIIKKNTKQAFSSLGIGRTNVRKIKEEPNETPQIIVPQLNIEPGTLFELESPSKLIYSEQQKGNTGLCENQETPMVEFELRILYPKRFQALRRFYCGTHTDFISSILRVVPWESSGGKTNSPFYKSHDEKYIIKEVKKSEFKMFMEFGPTYFDYMVKAFFHSYPCALAKILGAYVVKVNSSKNQAIKYKKYILVSENLNLGIKASEEQNIVRYDLKGSELNRFVSFKPDEPTKKVVFLDSNFLLNMNGRPIVMHKKLANLLHICINNDSLCLSKQNIIDYSLLTIINQKTKKIRFGIIDYLQIWGNLRLIEHLGKKLINQKDPTITDPASYRSRLTRFTKLYLIGIDSQKEIRLPSSASKEELQKSIKEGKTEIMQSFQEEIEVEESEHANSPIARNMSKILDLKFSTQDN